LHQVGKLFHKVFWILSIVWTTLYAIATVCWPQFVAFYRAWQCIRGGSKWKYSV